MSFMKVLLGAVALTASATAFASTTCGSAGAPPCGSDAHKAAQHKYMMENSRQYKAEHNYQQKVNNQNKSRTGEKPTPKAAQGGSASRQ